MTVTKITDRTVIFTFAENAESYVNIFLIMGRHNNFIIDTGVGESSIKAVLEYLGGDKKPIVAVNTHAHWDHIFGNSALEGSLIVSHTLCRDIMNAKWDTEITDAMKANRGYADAQIYKCLPNIVFDGILSFPDDGITLFHTPAHTPDGISIYDAVDKALYIGDNFGVIDGAAHLWGNDVSDFERLLETYKQYDFEICLPSHAPPQAREVLIMLEAATAKARRL